MFELPTRLWLEALLTLFSAGALAATLIWPQWIEVLFAIEPDHGDGSSEWGFALVLVAITFVAFAATIRDLRRLQR